MADQPEPRTTRELYLRIARESATEFRHVRPATVRLCAWIAAAELACIIALVLIHG